MMVHKISERDVEIDIFTNRIELIVLEKKFVQGVEKSLTGLKVVFLFTRITLWKDRSMH